MVRVEVNDRTIRPNPVDAGNAFIVSVDAFEFQFTDDTWEWDIFNFTEDYIPYERV